MTGKLVFEERLEIPPDLDDLASFRRWTASDGFPAEGRLDYVRGQIEVDMTPEDLFTHGAVKTEIVAVLHGLSRSRVPGDVFTDSTRIASVPGDVSAEPDVVFLSEESLRSGRVRLVPKASGEPDRYVEIEGGPDIVVEIVSDTSVGKDTGRLPPAYHRAGVGEFWLVDARGPEVELTIHRRGAGGFEPETPDEGGYRRSDVLGVRFRLSRERRAVGGWRYELAVEE